MARSSWKVLIILARLLAACCVARRVDETNSSPSETPQWGVSTIPLIPMGHINIEMKARCRQPDEVRSFLSAQKAEYRGLDHQIDTYFNVRHGRLKLRQGTIENALIHYEREEKAGPKQSNVLLYQAAPDPTLKAILTKALGILVVVEKQRQIYFLGNVKFHIDTVPQLGSFVEIEAIDREGTIGQARLLRQCQKFCQELGLAQQDLVSVSYSDLLLQQHPPVESV